MVVSILVMGDDKVDADDYTLSNKVHTFKIVLMSDLGCRISGNITPLFDLSLCYYFVLHTMLL